jgi:hypothetical protein
MKEIKMKPDIAVSFASVLVMALIFLLGGCASSDPELDQISSRGAGQVVFNKYNLHYYIKVNRMTKDVEKIASYANYVDPPNHRIIPYNTPLTIGKYIRGFSIILHDSKEKIFFEYKEINMNGMSALDYIKLITSETQVDYSHLSAIDRQGIDKGIPLRGMTREGIMIALGYPAMHRTPSLDENTWVYWKDRFAQISIRFENDKVSEIID